MDTFQAIILGVIQGLGEFLPISSTAHLVLTPYFFGWEDPGLSFNVALHAGTLIAVLVYFWRDWIDIFANAFQGILHKFKKKHYSYKGDYNKNILWLLVLATIPGVLAGLFLEEYAETVFRNPLIIAFTLSFVGTLLYLADVLLKHRKEMNKVTVIDSLIIGVAQAIAIIPGVSRSGATMTAGLWVGLSRESAARFSFLMSTPIILGATLSQIPNFMRGEFGLGLFLGILTAAVSGYWAISFLLKFLQKASFSIFVWYRIILSLLIVAVYIIN